MEIYSLLGSPHGDHLKEVSCLLGWSHGDHLTSQSHYLIEIWGVNDFAKKKTFLFIFEPSDAYN